MPRVLLVLLTLLWLPLAGARAAEAVFELFDAAPLAAAEKRLLQAALTVSGDYRGGLDGAWGPESWHALAAFAAREFADRPLNVHAAILALAFSDEVEASGWRFHHDAALGVSLALPELGPEQAEEGGRRWWSRSGSLTLLMHRFDPDEARSWHAAAAAANARPEKLETLHRQDRMLTGGELADGRTFLAQSLRVDDHWATVHLASGPDELGSLRLIAATVRSGPPLGWELPVGGRLARIVAEATEVLAQTGDGEPVLLSAAPGRAAEARAHEFEPPAATGTGFYVAPRTLVTAEHVVQGCLGIAFPDGTPLTLVASDAELDVAVLEAPRAARAWLALPEDRQVRLGERLHAAGYPYYSITGTSLHLTGGNVSALAGVDDDPRFFSFTAPVQPGSSGGPLIGAGGTVLGVAVARLSETYIAEATGSLPQNVNFALRHTELAAFLAATGRLPAPDGLDFDLDAGAPDAFTDAVVPIVCQ